jgi:hypothetical protein
MSNGGDGGVETTPALNTWFPVPVAPRQGPCAVCCVTSRGLQCLPGSAPHLDASEWMSFQTVRLLNSSEHPTNSPHPRKPSLSALDCLKSLSTGPSLIHEYCLIGGSPIQPPIATGHSHIVLFAPVSTLLLVLGCTYRFRRSVKLPATIPLAISANTGAGRRSFQFSLDNS